MNKPIKKFSKGTGEGNITVSVWENEKEGKDGKKFAYKSYTIQSSYPDKEGVWQEKKSFNYSEVAILKEILGSALSEEIKAQYDKHEGYGEKV